ncbi:MAG: C25 family cysteine peptidase [bacterium]|nr:C25 family cysteine peptidase [bacterium]
MSRSTICAILMLLLAYSSQAGEITIRRDLTEPTLVHSDGYDQFATAPGPLYGDPGTPLLPHDGRQILLPPGEEITAVTLQNEVWKTVPGPVTLYPAQPLIPYSQTDLPPFTEPNPAIYSSNEYYPNSQIEHFRTDFLSGHGIGSMAVTTVRYQPAAHRLETLSSYDLIIHTRATSKAQTAYNTLLHQTSEVSDRLNHLVENPQAISQYGVVDQTDLFGVQYLIITNSELAPTFQTLLEHRQSRGMTSELALVEDIAMQYPGTDLQDKIRNCIKDYFINQGLEYVLLGGDVEFVPKRGLFATVGGELDGDIPADLYFSNLDGNWNDDGDDWWGEPTEADLYSEVQIGRMPASNPSEAQNLIAKTIAYENIPVIGDLEKGLMVGEELGWSVTGGQIKEEIRTGSNHWGYTTAGFPSNFDVDVLYDDNGTWNAMTNLLPLLNGGVQFVNHMGHGNNTWVMKFSPSQVNDNNMTNNGVNHNFYIAYSQACYSGAFDNRTPDGSYIGDCICEKFTSIQNASVAFLCNSRYGWGSGSNTNGPSQYFDRQFFDAIFGEHIYRLGRANTDSKEDNIPWIGGATFWCYYEINLFGDPALDVWTETPQSFTPTYPVAIELNTRQIDFQVGVVGATLALQFEGELLGIATSNNNGEATIFLDEPISTPGLLDLTITAHNYLPYFTHIYVIPPNGAWIQMPFAAFDDVQGGNGNGIPELGETLTLSATFRNVGSQTASNVMATFSSDDYCIDVTEGTVSLGNIASGDSVSVLNAFRFIVGPNVRNGQQLSFHLTITDSQGDSWTNDLALTAAAPDLKLVSCTVTDGNDNQLLPGETGTISFKFTNVGGYGTSDLSLMLNSDNPGVSMINATSVTSPLAAGDTVEVSGMQFNVGLTVTNPCALILYVTLRDTRNYQDNFLMEIPVGGEYDNMENGVGDWTHQTVTPSFGDEWNLSDLMNHTPGGASSWHCGSTTQYSSLLDAGLVTPEYPIHGKHRLGFYHFMMAGLAQGYPGYAYDGGIVEYSLNGAPYTQITPRGGYPYHIRNFSQTGPFADETPCYSGQMVWQEANFDIEGEGSVRFRFRFGSDETGTALGWVIDDLALLKESDPAVPTNLSAEQSGEEIQLHWNTPEILTEPGKGLAGNREVESLQKYFVYRNNSLIDSIEGISYVDNLRNLQYSSYSYQVSGIYDGVEGPLCAPVWIDYVGVTPGQTTSPLPTETALRNAYPNPFNPVITLSFDLKASSVVTLKVYDTLGREVATLAEGNLSAGSHQAQWNATGRASGVYLVQLEAGSYVGLKKVVLLK